MFVSSLGCRFAARAAAAAVITLSVAGCRIDTHSGKGGKDDVSIQTPLGGMNVKTDTPGVLARVGLPAYPGAIEDRKKDKDNGAADIDMSFGDFRLRVLAVGYTTPDAPDKVRAFYAQSLAQFGDVIECRNHQPVGALKRTGQGLTCADDGHVHADGKHDGGDRGDNDTQLRAGSPSRQHIVSFEPRDGGTHFGLVSLELPHGLGKS